MTVVKGSGFPNMWSGVGAFLQKGQRPLDAAEGYLMNVNLPSIGSYANTYAVNITQSQYYSGGAQSSGSFTVPADSRVDQLITSVDNLTRCVAILLGYIQTHPVLAVHDRLEEAGKETTP